MRHIARIGIFFFLLFTIQVISYYAIGMKALIRKTGANFESYVLNYGENKFENVGILTSFKFSQNQLKESFKVFKDFETKICKNVEECSSLRDTDHFYIYSFDLETKNPFSINTIHESEIATEFIATWESKYVWIVYKWYLIDKQNIIIS